MPWSASPGVPAHLPTVGARAANGEFGLFASAGASPGTSTQLAWKVDDIDVTVHERRSRGVGFEQYDLPGIRTARPDRGDRRRLSSKGIGERAAWFRDSEGHTLGIAQPVRAPAKDGRYARDIRASAFGRQSSTAARNERRCRSGRLRAVWEFALPRRSLRLREWHSRRRRLAGRWMGAA
jgi:hypothetical protein